MNIPKNEWVHLKLEVRDGSATLYATDMTKPVMVVERLDLAPKP